MINVGENAVDFTLVGTAGTYNLHHALKSGSILLIFYPRDNSSG